MANTDKFLYVGLPGTATNLAAPGHTIGGGTFNVGSTSNWPTASGVAFAVDRVTLVGTVATQVPGSYTEWVGDVTGGTTISGAVLSAFSPNSDQNYSAGTTTRVYIPVSATRENRLVQGILTHADQDGTLKAGAVDVAAVLADGVVTTTKILDANVTAVKLSTSAVTSDKIATDSHVIAYAETTTGQSFATTGPVDATSMTVTFTTPLSCTKIRLCAEATISSDTAAATNTLYITDNSNNVQVKRDIITGQSNAGALQHIKVSRRITVTANTSYTFKIRVGNSTGTTVLNQGNSVNSPTELWVERA